MHRATLRRLSETRTLSIIYSNRKAPVIKTALPEASVLRIQQYDYSVSYLTTFRDASDTVQPADLAYAFYSVLPRCVNGLMLLINLIVKRFSFSALKNTFTGKAALGKSPGEGPEKLWFFNSLHQTADEVVFGKTGRHLDIQHSILVHKPRKGGFQKNVLVSTAVTFHTRFGRFYFSIIKPLLHYLTPLHLKRAISRIEARHAKLNAHVNLDCTV